MTKILVTGGSGYIGSHTCVRLLEQGFDIVVVDNLSNSKRQVIQRLEQLTGKTIPFYPIDVASRDDLDRVFAEHAINAVIHFAGFKAVGESVEKPLMYYRNNLVSTLTLCDAMVEHGVSRFVFSSSATVYGIPDKVPLVEDFPLGCTNPYGWTKLMIEQILRDVHVAHPAWSVVLLRYFNPVGAHPSGQIGEDPTGIPNNLMPYISQVAIGRLERLSVFGDDYPTPDGTGVRDYIHVMDLADGHVAAVNYAMKHQGVEAVNLGTGEGYSVLQLVEAFERVNQVEIPYRIAGRRAGDIAASYADPTRAKQLLNWQATRSLDDMCRDSWNWQTKNPNGYSD